MSKKAKCKKCGRHVAVGSLGSDGERCRWCQGEYKCSRCGKPYSHLWAGFYGLFCGDGRTYICKDCSDAREIERFGAGLRACSFCQRRFTVFPSEKRTTLCPEHRALWDDMQSKRVSGRIKGGEKATCENCGEEYHTTSRAEESICKECRSEINSEIRKGGSSAHIQPLNGRFCRECGEPLRGGYWLWCPTHKAVKETIYAGSMDEHTIATSY